jgi:protein-tyrosine phosphatase
MSSYNEILENLYIGNRESITFYTRFSLIVNCTKTDVQCPPNHNNCIRIPIDDIPDESDNLTQIIARTNILEKIHKTLSEKKQVLVHCNAGRQRSCAVVACYLVKYYNMTPIQAVEYIKSKRREAFFGSVNFAKTINEMSYT